MKQAAPNLCRKGHPGENLHRAGLAGHQNTHTLVDLVGSRMTFGEFRRSSQRWAVRGQTVAVAGLRRGDAPEGLATPEHLIKVLLKKGFKKKEVVEQANLEDVFIDLTGKALRE